METLASQLTSTLRLPSMVSVSFKGRLSSSIVLTKPSSRVHTFRCSALSSPSLVDQSERFSEASKKGNLIPLYRTIFSDHLTPVLAYRCLVKEADIDAPSFLFESVEPGLRACSIGRNSVVGAQPAIEIVAKENMVTILDHEEGCRTEEIVEDPKIVPQRLMEGWTPQLVDELPEAFCGRWVGFFSYDSVRYVEKKKLPFSSAPLDDRNIPDVHLGLYDDVIVFDHVEKDDMKHQFLALAVDYASVICCRVSLRQKALIMVTALYGYVDGWISSTINPPDYLRVTLRITGLWV